eukprot:2474615-Rhodomonas_salina.1
MLLALSHFLVLSGVSPLREHRWQKEQLWITTWSMLRSCHAAAKQSEWILPCKKRAFLSSLAH